MVNKLESDIIITILYGQLFMYDFTEIFYILFSIEIPFLASYLLSDDTDGTSLNLN